MMFGSADLLTSGIGSFTGRICQSYGNGQANCQNLPASNTPERDHLVMTLGDFDGDGVPDILRPANNAWVEDDIKGYLLCKVGTDRLRGADPLYHRCSSWTGPVFHSVQLQSVFGDADSGLAEESPRSMFYGDFDGDGKQDIATYLGNGQWQIHGAARQAKLHEALDRLVSVVNGRGNTETVDYALPNDAAVYSSTVARPDEQNLIGKLTYPSRPLVKAVHKGNGIAGTRDESYHYARMAMDADGRGNLGFAEITRTDAQRGITTTTWPCLAYPNIGAECGHQDVSVLRYVLNSTSNVWVTQKIDYANGTSTNYGYLSRSTVGRRDPGNADLGTVTTTTLAPDAWGNVLDTTSVYAPAGWSVHKAMKYDNSPDSWRLGELRKLTETRTNGDNAFNTISRTTSYTYDDQGLLKTEVRDIDDASQKLTTTYDRSTVPYGLVGKTVLSWTDSNAKAKSRTVSDVSYTPNGRFVSSITNAIGQIERRTFDPRSGVVASVTSANALTTLTSSDGFGRIQRITAPDGNASETYYKSCSSYCPFGATGAVVHETKQAGDVLTTVPVLQFTDDAGHVVRTQTWGFDGRKVITDAVFDEVGRLQKTYWPRYATDSEASSSISRDPSGAILQQQTSYDELDRQVLLTTLGELGDQRLTRHTWQGFIHTVENPKHQTIQETRDVWGKLTQTVDANGKITKFEFDAFGNLSRTTDPLDNKVAVTFDTWGRRTQLQDPDLGTITYKVDPLGQVWRQTSPNEAAKGTSTTITFDDLGRMTSRTSEDMTATWTYDLLPGQVKCADYHSCGQMVRSATVTGGSTLDYHQDHSFDPYGRQDTTSTWLDVLYTSQQNYDAWGRPISERYQRGSDSAKVYDRRYNAWGHLAHEADLIKNAARVGQHHTHEHSIGALDAVTALWQSQADA
jgi:YD repeat-containing protein